MFDRYDLSRPQRGTTHQDVRVNITEKRASTDESVKLLRELEAAAEARVTDRVRVADNGINCEVQVWDEAYKPSRTFKVVLDLNGRRIIEEVSFDGYERLSPDEVAVKIRDALAQRIASEVLQEALRPVAKQLFIR